MKMYLLERIKDSYCYKKGERIWAYQRCKGWKVIEIRDIYITNDGHQRWL